MADAPPVDDTAQRLALIQQMWLELKTAGKDPTKYRGLSARIRRESNVLWDRDYPHKPES